MAGTVVNGMAIKVGHFAVLSIRELVPLLRRFFAEWRSGGDEQIGTLRVSFQIKFPVH